MDTTELNKPGSMWLARLEKIRAMPEGERPLDAQNLLRCHELHELCVRELEVGFGKRERQSCTARPRGRGRISIYACKSLRRRAVLSSSRQHPAAAPQGWRGWPADGRTCSPASVRAFAALLASVDAAPAELEVFYPRHDRNLYGGALLGPVLLRSERPSPDVCLTQPNQELHNQCWGTPCLEGMGFDLELGDIPTMDPDVLIKWCAAGECSAAGAACKACTLCASCAECRRAAPCCWGLRQACFFGRVAAGLCTCCSQHHMHCVKSSSTTLMRTLAARPISCCSLPLDLQPER